ncbi:CBF1-interacting co-repressor CIR, N-terminal domain containing protein [Parasponia andersonii]|uniref:CBF1-interacting co-repressor CIR, N-terminal domain containing protein n=1 Tax=Parasponia andersonii TaxID=3476 RepID=A0A2P5AVV2_PARAD|nr:CBF1-interacting co-repressor CIR, N-terminal domain containing protein [Parasponia andersonii]
MGGHGGLNILPQKRWNVYNFENREKVRKDEEAAAKEEQLKREQARKRDSEYRLEQLRAARGLAPVIKAAAAEEPNEPQPKSAHINLFEGIKIFDPIKGSENERERGDERDGGSKKKMKLMKKEEAEKTKVVTAEDEKYRLGYGLAGKGVKLPWYLERRGAEEDGLNVEGGQSNGSSTEEAKKSGRKKKTLEELREERLRREKREKERERALITPRDRVIDRANPRHRKFSRSIVFGIESFALQVSAFVDILVPITGVV